MLALKTLQDLIIGTGNILNPTRKNPKNWRRKLTISDPETN